MARAIFVGWLAVAFTIVLVAYLAQYRRIFGKRADGRLGVLHVVVLFPFLAFTWLTWHLARIVSREPMMHALTPNVRIGRRLLARELPADVDHVVDLTAEFREVARARGYTGLPILDASVPDRDELRRALDAVPKTGSVYVHCAQGHGRTALFASCLLIAREGLDADIAIARVLAVRPLARMKAAQRAFVREFAVQSRECRVGASHTTRPSH